MAQKLRRFFGILGSAGVLVACGDGLSAPSDASPSPFPGGMAPGSTSGSPQTMGGQGNTSNGSPANTATPGVTEGNPAVTNIGTPNTGTPSSGTPSSGTPNAGTPNAGTPNTGTPNAGMPNTGSPPNTGTPVAGPADVEPTDCVIPAVPMRPIGYGANTTGGGNTAPVIVNSFAAAEAALAAYRDAFDEGTATSLVLRYTGTFNFASITDVCTQHELEPQVLEIKEMENVTFEGAPGSSGNFGLKVNRAKNVIIRNMTLGLLPGGGDSDAITVEGNDTNGDVENVWLDHNELFSSTRDDCPGAGDTEFDGLIDIKKGARFITVSYNYLHDHQKTGLLGFSDSDDTERYVTFHHNRYENVVSRTPLHRFGYVHLFNNYYGNVSDSGINVRMGGVALVESNFFENVANPVTSRFSGEFGFWELRNNHVGPGITWTPDEDAFVNAENWQNTTTFPASELTYAYTPDRAGCVKQIVTALAGARL